MTRLILKDANIVDGDGPARRGSLVVAGERIESVGDAMVEARAGDRVVSLDGRTVMPGMVLGHYHASYWYMDATRAPLGLDAPVALQTLRAASTLKLALECGFTGVISAGSPNGIDASLKAAIAEGTIAGPHMLACSRDVSSTGHSSDRTFPTWWQIGALGGIHCANGADDFRRVVREEIKNGAEIIKLFITGGHVTGGPGTIWEMDRDEVVAATRAAHDRGVKVRAHIANREASLMALDLGVHIIDHGDGFDDACMDKILKCGAFLAPSLFFPKAMFSAMPGQHFIEIMREPYKEMVKILPRLNAAGVKLLIGDDYGVMGFDHGRYAEELALYVNEVGIPARDVIRWATKHGAEALGMGDQTGTLVPGKLADLLVVDGDPIADITILQDRSRLLGIMKCGRLIKDELAGLKNAAREMQFAGAA